MVNKYRYNNGEIQGVIGEKTVYIEFFNKYNITALVTKEKDYFNVYIIDENYKSEPLNNLNENIPLENKPKDWSFYLLLKVIEFSLWHDFNKDFTITYEEVIG